MSEKVGEIYYDVDLDNKKFDKGVSHVNNSLAGLEKSFVRAEAGSFAFAGGLTAIATAGVSALGFGVKLAGDLEAMRMGFVTLLGSTEKADKAIEMIKKDAASTPFELPGLISANQLLTSVTKDAERSEKFLLNVGKALSAMGKGQPELDRIIVNLQQIGAVGKASMMDIKQFAFAGIPIFDMLNKKFGEGTVVIKDNSKEITQNSAKLEDLKNKLDVAKQRQKEFTDSTKESTKMTVKNQIDKYKEQIRALTGELDGLNKSNGQMIEGQGALDDLIADGKVTFELLEEMFNEAGEAGGQFANSFSNMAGTFNQLLSNLKDNIGIAAVKIVTDLGAFDVVKNALSMLVDAIGQNTDRITEMLKNAFSWIVENAPMLTGLILGGLTPAFYALATSVWATMAPLIPFLAIGAALGYLINELVKQMGGWDVAIQKIQESFNFLKDMFMKWIMPQLQMLWDEIKNNLYPAFMELWKLIEPAILPTLKVLGAIIGTVLIVAINAIVLALRGVVAYLTTWINMTKFAIETIVGIFRWLYDVLIGNSIIPDLINGITGWFKRLPGMLTSALSGLGNAITKPFKDAFDSVSKMADKAWQQLQKINPYHRNSPSLVDNITKGMDFIEDKINGVNLKLPGISSMVDENSLTSTAKTSPNVNVYVDKVNDKVDLDLLGREVGFRASLVPSIR